MIGFPERRNEAMSLPYDEMMERLRKHKGIAEPKCLEFSVWFWVKHPERIEMTRKTKIGITPSALEVLDIVEEYAREDESELIQRLSESYRSEFIFNREAD